MLKTNHEVIKIVKIWYSCIQAWRNWCSVLTWAASLSTLDHILPMDTSVLRAMLWDFTYLGASNSTLKSRVEFFRLVGVGLAH